MDKPYTNALFQWVGSQPETTPFIQSVDRMIVLLQVATFLLANLSDVEEVKLKTSHHNATKKDKALKGLCKLLIHKLFDL
jgi:hypothetical protein